MDMICVEWVCVFSAHGMPLSSEWDITDQLRI